jgi:RND superfamily putative drug exporter
VLVDAFVVRITIVPALMAVAGRSNWWAPAPLRRLHDRWGVHEHDDGVVIDLTDSALTEEIDLRDPAPAPTPAAEAGAARPRRDVSP